jgi:DNA-binding NarL/FixJ family response regulator
LGGKFEEKRAQTKSEAYQVKPPVKGAGLSTKLTQLETLELYNKGMAVEEIAARRDLSVKSVKEHLRYLREKGIIE